MEFDDNTQPTDILREFLSIIEALFPPAEGEVFFLNDTDSYITVDTFDEMDTLKWIPYQRQAIAPHEGAKLTARGNRVQVRVNGGSTFTCDKSRQYYLYNGQNAYPRVA